MILILKRKYCHIYIINVWTDHIEIYSFLCLIIFVIIYHIDESKEKDMEINNFYRIFNSHNKEEKMKRRFKMENIWMNTSVIAIILYNYLRFQYQCIGTFRQWPMK